MTNSVHFPARPDAPIVCDMSTAEDTHDERRREYERLFETVLLRRERHTGSVVFSFRADPGTRESIEDLARREAACCPFLDQRVESVDGEVVWTVTDLAGLFSRLADDDVPVVERTDGFGIRST